MRKIMSVLYFLCVAATLLNAPCSFAEVRQQKDGLFKIDIPDGWRWIEKMGDIGVVNPTGDNGISIIYGQRSGYSEESARQALEMSIQSVKKMIKTKHKGTIVDDDKIMIGGVYARRINFTMIIANRQNSATYIVLIHNNIAFTITYGSPDNAEKSIMDKAVNSIRFTH